MSGVNKIQQEVQVLKITKQFEEEARKLILKGLEERFGFIDPAYNPDLINIIKSYSQKGQVFLIGVYDNRVVCTGAVSCEEAGVGRIERMSVKKECRRLGLAKLMIQCLELSAKQEGYHKVVLETNNNWQSAIEFYNKNGYELYLDDEKCSHFYKHLS
ncbi:GNAT family N-acetyltransferase [Paenisporosarcina sp. TG20]|uniref:GNAT family N-acetyltransferase n=1 Tax=Paenisporosarcina sp. TG20 TaxID=1211706 RepID=UPI0002F229D6|nr:GNAT family N-acetyltransferase [Paenisporosarcina sp. TG20]